MIYETVFEDAEFTVMQLGNWQFTRVREGYSYWEWVPQSQSRGTRCLRHPKPHFHDGVACDLCALESERLTAGLR